MPDPIYNPNNIVRKEKVNSNSDIPEYNPNNIVKKEVVDTRTFDRDSNVELPKYTTPQDLEIDSAINFIDKQAVESGRIALTEERKGVLKDVLKNPNATKEQKEQAMLTVQGYDKDTSGDVSNKFYMQQDVNGVYVPKLLKHGQRPPKGTAINSFHGTQADANDDAWYTDLSKSLANGLVGAAGGVVDLVQAGQQLITGEESEILNDARNSVDFFKFKKDEDLNKSIYNTEGITKWADLLDKDRIDLTPSALWGTFNGLAESLSEFGFGTVVGGSLIKGAKAAKYALQGVEKAVELGNAAQKSAIVFGSTIAQLGDVMEAGKEAGLKGRDLPAFALTTATAMGAIDAMTGLEGKVMSDLFKKSKSQILKNAIKTVERDAAGNITPQAFKELAKRTSIQYGEMAGNAGKEIVKDAIGEGTQEAVQDFTQKAAENLWDKMTDDERGQFGTDAFDAKSFGSYLNSFATGAISGVPMAIQQQASKKRNEEQSIHVYDRVKKGEEGVKALRVDLNEALANNDISQSEYEQANFKIDKYKQYHELTSKYNIDTKDEKRAFELSFQIEGMKTEIPTNENLISKLDPIQRSEVEADQSQVKTLQKELNEIMLRAKVKGEPTVGKKTEETIIKEKEKEVTEEVSKVEGILKEQQTNSKLSQEKEVEKAKTRQPDIEGLGKEKVITYPKLENKPYWKDDKRTYEEIDTEEFNNPSTDARTIHRVIRKEAYNKPNRKLFGNLTKRLYSYVNDEGDRMKGDVIEVTMEDGKKIRVASSKQEFKDENDKTVRWDDIFRRHFRSERTQGNEEGLPVGIRAVDLNNPLNEDRGPDYKPGKIALKVFDARTGKFLSWAKETKTGSAESLDKAGNELYTAEQKDLLKTLEQQMYNENPEGGDVIERLTKPKPKPTPTEKAKVATEKIVEEGKAKVKEQKGANKVTLNNISDIIKNGYGRLSVSKNGENIAFDKFDIAIDNDTKTAEVVFVQKKDRVANKGIGLESYIELGERLKEKGITLQSLGQPQLIGGRYVWDTLVKNGLAKRIATGSYEYTGKNETENKSKSPSELSLSELNELPNRENFEETNKQALSELNSIDFNDKQSVKDGISKILEIINNKFIPENKVEQVLKTKEKLIGNNNYYTKEYLEKYIQFTTKDFSELTKEQKASIPLTITKAVRQQLYDLGYSKVNVDNMKPERALDIINKQEVKPKEGKPATTPTDLEALKQTTEKVIDNTSETKDAINNTPIQPSKASGNKVLYTPRKIVELAYANDKDNNPDLGGSGQELSNIIRRGGYAIEELDVHLPGWRTMSFDSKVEPTVINKSFSEQETNKKENEPVVVKSGVSEVFNSNPELANIGTQEQYSQYLDTVFPDSQLKDIVYHSSPNKIEKFRDSMFGNYFSYSPIKNVYGNIIHNILLNVKNPLVKPKSTDSTEVKIKYDKEYRNYNNPSSLNDASIEASTVTEDGTQVRVKNPEQIHILGGKEDLEGFKKFVSNEIKNKKEVSQEKEPTAKKDSASLRRKITGYNQLSSDEKKSDFGVNLRKEIQKEVEEFGGSLQPLLKGKIQLLDSEGKQVKKAPIKRKQSVIDAEKAIAKKRKDALSTNPTTPEQYIAMVIGSKGQFKESVVGEIPDVPSMMKDFKNGYTLESLYQGYQEKSGFYDINEDDFNSKANSFLSDYLTKGGRDLAIDYAVEAYEREINDGKTDKELADEIAYGESLGLTENEVVVIDESVQNLNEEEVTELETKIENTNEKDRNEESANKIIQNIAGEEGSNKSPFDEMESEQDSEEGKDIIKGEEGVEPFQKVSQRKGDFQKVFEKIKANFKGITVVKDASKFKGEQSTVAGKVSADGKFIYINPNYAGLDTPIHEAGHILIDAMGYNNRIIQAAIKQLRTTPLYAETKERYKELSESELDKEVLAEAIGREGADIFDKVEDRSKFKAYLDYIFDWLKQKLGLDKNVAKSLAKQIIGGVKTKELKGIATGKEQLQKDKKKPFADQALKYNQYATAEGFDAQKEFDKYEQATVELREVKEDEKLATIAADEAVTDKEIKEADAELEKQRALLKEASKEFAIKAKRYLGYLKYKKDFRAVQAILKDKDLDEYTEKELNDLITKLFAFNDRAAKAVKERAYLRLGHLVTVKQNEIHKDKEGFIEALGKTSDISPLQSKILHYSQFSEKNADMQALALANGKAIIDKITEANSLKDTHAKLGLKVIQEENKRLGITGKAANRFSSDSSKYFEWMIDENGNYLTIDEAKAKGLSKAKLDYLDFHRETVAGYRESMSANDYENVKMGAIRVDKNFREAYKSEGLIPAFSYYLGGGATNLGRVRILHNGKVMSYSEIEKEIIAGVDKKNIKSIAKALYDLLVANIKARYQLKKGQNIDEKDNPLELKGDAEYSLNEKGQLVSKFDKPRAKDRGYSKDFYKAMNQFIDESAHVKHISKIMPLVESIEYLNKYGYMEEGYVPKKNVSKWINDWKALQIFKEPYVNDPVIDAAIKSLRKLVASTTMWFNIPANAINVFVGNYNNWRAENAETLARGNARLFGGKGSRKKVGIVNDYALAIIKKYNLVNQDFDSHPVIKAGSVFSKLATWGTQVGEYQIQGSLGLGLLSQEEFDSFEFTKDKYGNDVLTVKKGVDEDKIKSKMTQVKNRVTDIQGKYPDEDRRNIMRGEFGKALFQFKVWMPDWFKERFSARYFNAYGQEKEGSYTKMLRVGVKEMAADLKKGDIKKALTNPAFVQNLKGMATIGALLALKHSDDDDDDKKKGGLNWDSALSQVLFIFDLEQDKYMVSNPAAILGKIKDMLNAFEALVGFEEDAWQKTKRILPGGKAVTFVENQIK